jgi:hypothetical protein
VLLYGVIAQNNVIFTDIRISNLTGSKNEDEEKGICMTKYETVSEEKIKINTQTNQ